MIRKRFPSAALAACLALTVASRPACAQEQEEGPPTPEEIQAAESAPLFASHEILEITLEADFHTIRRDDRSDEDSEERPARMEWTNPDGSVEAQDIQIRTRGIFPRSASMSRQGRWKVHCSRVRTSLSSW
jgi:hypothetical protein